MSECQIERVDMVSGLESVHDMARHAVLVSSDFEMSNVSLRVCQSTDRTDKLRPMEQDTEGHIKGYNPIYVQESDPME